MLRDSFEFGIYCQLLCNFAQCTDFCCCFCVCGNWICDNPTPQNSPALCPCCCHLIADICGRRQQARKRQRQRRRERKWERQRRLQLVHLVFATLLHFPSNWSSMCHASNCWQLRGNRGSGCRDCGALWATVGASPFSWRCRFLASSYFRLYFDLR